MSDNKIPFHKTTPFVKSLDQDDVTIPFYRRYSNKVRSRTSCESKWRGAVQIRDEARLIGRQKWTQKFYGNGSGMKSLAAVLKKLWDGSVL